MPLLQAAPIWSRVSLLSITADVHKTAESIAPHVKTLDALHIATALLLIQQQRSPVAIASHDEAMKSVAVQLGLQVVDPITGEG